MIKLESVYNDNYAEYLYELLYERTPEQSISHQKMPTIEQHIAFINSHPYRSWFIIKDENDIIVGSIYLSYQREIGVFIFKDFQGCGFGKEAVEKLMEMFPGKFLWNVNPKNEASIKLVESLGGKLIQWTFEINGNHS